MTMDCSGNEHVIDIKENNIHEVPFQWKGQEKPKRDIKKT